MPFFCTSLWSPFEWKGAALVEQRCFDYVPCQEVWGPPSFSEEEPGAGKVEGSGAETRQEYNMPKFLLVRRSEENSHISCNSRFKPWSRHL